MLSNHVVFFFDDQNSAVVVPSTIMQSGIKRKRDDVSEVAESNQNDHEPEVDPMAWVDQLSVKELQMELKERKVNKP
jgi:hypothetical protein